MIRRMPSKVALRQGTSASHAQATAMPSSRDQAGRSEGGRWVMEHGVASTRRSPFAT